MNKTLFLMGAILLFTTKSIAQVGTPKEEFIKNQDYLTGNLLDQKNKSYKDSLKGFNESAIRAELTGKIDAWELNGHINHLRREFINTKYQLKPITENTIPQVPSNQKQMGGGAQVYVAPCVNEGFENTAPGAYNGAANALSVQGWTLFGNYATNAGYNCNALGTPYNLGANEFDIVTTPLNFSGSNCSFVLGNSPFGGSRVAKINSGQSANYSRNKMAQTFPVTQANALFQFAFAGFWENPGHSCCDQPGLYLRVLNACNGNTVASCSSMTLAANCGSLANVTFTPCGYGVMSNWQTKSIDLTPYIGGCVTIEMWTADCNFGGHWGTTYIDCICGGQNISPGLGGLPGGPIPGAVSFCAGSGVAQINAPLGYNFYQWVGPNGPIPPPMGTTAVITITNPIPGQSYTVNLTSSGGCQLSSISQLNTTTVMIAGIGSGTTCPGGASGTASVQGAGSGAGYTYTWTNASNSVVGTSSVANNLPAGVYSVTIAGAGNALCGTASATVAVTTGTPQVINQYKPYCNGQAYMNTTGGTNFQWYNGNSPVQGTVGTAPGYTVLNPSPGAVINLTYTNLQNCNAQISFTLMASQPGIMNVSNISYVCPGGNNGTAVLSMTPANGAPPGVNSYSVVNNGTFTPPYSYSLYPTALNSVTLQGLSAGNYTVNTFDGSCLYSTGFNVQAFVFNFTLSPNSPTLCQGNCIPSGLTFTSPPSPTQYSYSWTPTTWLSGGMGNLQNTIICPTVPLGTQTTIVYTVVATPSVVNCPVTRTMAITAVNPATPTITAIPNMCDNALPYQILVNPGGGTFFTGITGTANPINPSTGMLNPGSPSITIGVNTFTYSTAVNTCVAQQTATYQVSHFNPSTLTSSISPLCVTNAPVNLMNIVQSTVGIWSGPGVNTNSFNPFGLSTGNYIISYNTTSNPNPTVCPSTSTLSIPVTNTIVPQITPAPPFCNNAAPFTMTVNPPGGTWANAAINPTSGLVTPSLAIPTNSIVGYSVTIGPCQNIGATIIYPSEFNSASISGTVPNLCVNSNPFSLMNIVQFTANGTWSGPGITNNVFFPVGLPTNTYTLIYNRVSTPNTTLCPDTRTIAVDVYNPPVPNIAMVGPYCSKNAAVQMSVSPNTGYWISSSYLSASGLLTPSLCSVGQNAIQYVIGTNTCFASNTKYISIEAFVSAAISGKVPDQCNTNAVLNLQPLTANPSGIWSGPGITGSNFNPNATGSGSFVLNYNTASVPSGLCPDHSTVAVNVFSLANPAVTQVGPFCNTAGPVQLQVSPVGGYFGGANNSAVTNKGLFHPGQGVIGNNVVNYSITAGPCVAYVQTTISIESFVSADLAKYPEKNIYCQKSDKPFNLNQYVKNVGGTWFGPGLMGAVFDPEKANIGQNLLIYQTHSMPTASLCPDTTALLIKVAQIPTISITSNKTEGCVPLDVLLTTPNNSGGSGQWYLGDGSEPKTELSIVHTYTAPGSYTATYRYTSLDGCVAPTTSVSTAINVYENPKPNFTFADEVFISDATVQMNNLTTILSHHKYLWKIVGLADTFTTVNPVISFPKIGRYEVLLTAESIKGCKNTISKFIEVRNDFNVFVPNTFTPNDDELNDVFKPVFTSYGLDSKTFELEIFDRWGQSLFRSKDPNVGWDGTIKGEFAKEGVYVYRLRYKDNEGAVYNKMGHVTLIR